MNALPVTILVAILAFQPSPGFAKKTNQAIYEDPFDIAAGGSSLTRASQEAVLFANPALMCWGGKTFRWFGSQYAFIFPSAESVQSVTQLNGQSSQDSTDPDSEDQTADQTSQLFTTPLHLGVTNSTSLVTNNFGIAAFGRFEPDLKGQRHNDTGIPELRARSETYGGMLMSMATRLSSFMSVGMTVKYLYVSEVDFSIDIADQQAVKDLKSNPSSLASSAALGKGYGIDLGSLYFLQGNNIDYRFALKVDDLGDTQFTENQGPFKQTLHGGMGLTFHNSIDSIHMSVDYRDILGAYGEPLFMKLYAGLKLIIRNYVGLSFGYYQGYPSYGIRLDLLLVKIGFTTYTREMGDYPGEDGRSLSIFYFGLGF